MNKIFTILAIILFSSSLRAQVEPFDTDENGFRNISTLEHLRWVSENESAWSLNFELDNDIDAKDTKNWNEGKGFIPIGNKKTNYNGDFNGNNFKIRNLYINRPDELNIAFIGYYDGSDFFVKNLGIINCNFTGKSAVGGIIGTHNTGRLINCYVTGEVSAHYNVGGLVGNNASVIYLCYFVGNINGLSKYASIGGIAGNNASAIKECYAKGNINGSATMVGGLVGENSDGYIDYCYANNNITITGEYASIGGFVGKNNTEITNSYSTGIITGKSSHSAVGGFVGTNSSLIRQSYAMGNTKGISATGGLVGDNKGDVIDCYARGNVSGNYNIGGLVGVNFNTVSNCYATGIVSGTGPSVGGFMGENSNGTVSKCFWDKQSSKLNVSDAGTGKTTTEMKDRTTYTEVGWNFNRIWIIDPQKNDGYPYIEIRPVDIFDNTEKFSNGGF